MKDSAFLRGLRDGAPISLGYFAVAISLGIAARGAGLTAFQAALASLLNNASAGEFAAFTLIGAGAGYLEVALMTLVANARYLLMSCALSQKLDASTPLIPRLIIGFDVTDEIFGAYIAQPGPLNPRYAYGVILIALPGWALGTFLGVAMGSALPTLAPLFAFLSTGARVILLTVALSALAAWRFPVEEEAQP